MRAKQFINESKSYQPPSIEVGDSVMLGKFKNRKAEVKGFDTDKNNQPVLKTTKGDTQLFKPRIAKLVKEEVNDDCFNPAFNHTQIIDDLTYRATYDEDQLGKKYFQVKVFNDDFEKVGLAKFKRCSDDAGNEWVESLITAIHPQYNGKGIARNIYAYVRAMGNTIKPSSDQSDQGRGMWDSWRKSGDAKHLMAESSKLKFSTELPDRDTLWVMFENYYRSRDTRFFPHRVSTLIENLISPISLTESSNQSIKSLKEFQEYLKSLDGRDDLLIKIGSSLSVLKFTPHTSSIDKFIEVTGNIKPKIVKEIHTDPDDPGSIAYIVFTDNTSFPDQHFINNGKGSEWEGESTLFFDSANAADLALTAAALKLDTNHWRLATRNIA